MAYTATVKGQHVIIQMGDGAGTEIFTTICGVTEKGLQQTANVSETTTWDCADVNAAPQTTRDVLSLDWSITLSGQIDSAGYASLQTAYRTAAGKNFRFVFKDTVINKYMQGNGIVTEFTSTGTNGEKATFSMTITGNGAMGALTANP